MYISIRSNVFAVSLEDLDEPDLFLAELVLAELVLDPPVYLLFTLTEDVKEAVASALIFSARLSNPDQVASTKLVSPLAVDKYCCIFAI